LCNIYMKPVITFTYLINVGLGGLGKDTFICACVN
jgi:hypothetical protein